jgi:hypothetical protein
VSTGRCLLCGGPAMRPEAQSCLPCVVEALRTFDPDIVEEAIAQHDDMPDLAEWMRAVRDGGEA